MIIKKIGAGNFVGISETELEAAKINIIKGPKGSGKSSILEALEKLFMNTGRRTELIKHGESEAVLFVELDDGMSIERKLRDGKADYLKVRKGDEGVPSTEKFIRSLINGNIFRPVDWVNLPVMEQTKSILNMLKIEWTMEDILNWFGEEPSNVEYSQHILMVLKAIETKYYKDREEINRQVRELKSQMDVIKKELPENYNGDEWKDLKVQEYYNKVAEAQKINNYINEAKMLQEGIQGKIDTINANAENDKSKVQMKFKDQRQDIKDIIDLSNSKIEKANEVINNVDSEKLIAIRENNIKRNEEIRLIENKYAALEKEKLLEIETKAGVQKDIIQIQKNKISAKEQELSSLEPLEKQEIQNIEDKKASAIENENLRVAKSAEYLKQNEPVQIEPLQEEAEKVADMQSYLRQWDMFIDIRDNKLSDKERESAVYTERIETARTLPTQLMKTAQMPVEGISVDANGLIRINDTLIDGLSDGEKLELAMKIAKAQCGDLKVICIDRFESLNEKVQAQLMADMKTDDYQYFVTLVQDTESGTFEIEKINGGNQ